MQGWRWSRRGLVQEGTEKSSSPRILPVAALDKGQVVFPAHTALRHSRAAQGRRILA